MAKNKTEATTESIENFIATLDNEVKRDDAFALIKIYKAITGLDAKMWGPSIIGFGSCHYKYESGNEGDMPLACFSPRKSAFVLYLSSFEKKKEMLEKLGKHKVSGSCLHIKKLEDIDQGVLKKIITASFKNVKKKYPS